MRLGMQGALATPVTPVQTALEAMQVTAAARAMPGLKVITATPATTAMGALGALGAAPVIPVMLVMRGAKAAEAAEAAEAEVIIPLETQVQPGQLIRELAALLVQGVTPEETVEPPAEPVMLVQAATPEMLGLAQRLAMQVTPAMQVQTGTRVPLALLVQGLHQATPETPEARAQMATPETRVTLVQEPPQGAQRRIRGPVKMGRMEVRAIQVPLAPVQLPVEREVPVMRGPTETRVLRALRARGRRGVAQPPTHGQTKTGQTATLETQVPQALEPRMGERPRLAGPAKTA